MSEYYYYDEIADQYFYDVTIFMACFDDVRCSYRVSAEADLRGA